MTTIAQTDCCTMLGIDPKTLRNWLRQANMPFTAHPTDARLKCLTQGQVQQLAALHDRPLSSPLPAHCGQANQALLHPTISPWPNACLPEADLGPSLLRLQAHVTTMQEQLTQLALALLRERELRFEQRLSVLEALVPPAMASHPSPPVLAATTGADLPDAKPTRERRSPLAADAQGHSRVLPLIAYTATGTYIVICPQRGELSLIPDSPEWFDWLATLNSFRFLGQQGRLSAYCNQRRSCWIAYRRIHGHRYDHGLGNTKHLTIDALEQMAATLQSHVPSL